MNSTVSAPDRSASPSVGRWGSLRVTKPVGVWLAVWAVLTGLGFALAASHVLLVPSRGAPMTWGEALPMGLLDIYRSGGTALAAILLARAISLDRLGWAMAAVLHLVAGIGVLALRHWVGSWIGLLPPASGIRFLQFLPMNLLSYMAMVGAGYAFEYYRKFRDRELEAARLALQASNLQLAATRMEVELVQAQLSSLKGQIHPHFLFNALNAISSLVQTDQDRADRMIACLSALLRNTLAHQDSQEVTLREEVELLAPYLEIEKMRFGDRLSIHTSLAPDSLDACIPHLVLQPIVENAIRHGIAPRKDPGRVAITSYRDGSHLKMEVWDNGVGVAAGPRYRGSEGGIGLANIQTRLQRLYGSDHSFRIGNHPEGGALVELSVPFRVEPVLEARWLAGQE